MSGKITLSGYESKQDTAALLGVSERTLDRWAREGKGPPRTPLGGSVVYRRQAVLDWLAANEES
jgi:predicted DNA-binding transcriptional regulator AlpA